MPRLIRLYNTSIGVGFALACIFTALLVFLDVAHLGHLVRSTKGGIIAVVMLVWFHTILFSGVQFGYRVMRLGRDSDGKGGRRQLARRLIPSPQPASAPLPRQH